MPNNFLTNSEIVEKSGEDLDPRAEEFEKAYLEVVRIAADEIEAADPEVRLER